jgi:hypothetical protein
MTREREESLETQVVAANRDIAIQLNKKICVNAKEYIYASEKSDTVKDYLKTA